MTFVPFKFAYKDNTGITINLHTKAMQVVKEIVYAYNNTNKLIHK